jgi:hypothetical protein
MGGGPQTQTGPSQETMPCPDLNGNPIQAGYCGLVKTQRKLGSHQQIWSKGSKKIYVTYCIHASDPDLDFFTISTQP